MTIVLPQQTAWADRANVCLQKLDSVRTKDVRSTTLERLRLTREADRLVQGMPQPLQLAEG